MEKYKFTYEKVNLLKNILSTNTPSGNERQLIYLIKKYMKDICITRTDYMGNLFMYTGADDGIKIMITAHCDEVGFQITDIDEQGFAYVRRLGGLDRHTIPGTKVVALSKNGEVYGVFGKKSPHVQTDEERKKILNLEELWIDFGFISEKEALKYISTGDYVTARETPQLTYDNKRIISKALDNKICVFILMETITYLIKQNLSVQIVGVATTQEEIGSRGSIVAAQSEKPDIAFCLDVGIATDIPNMTKKTYGDFKLGFGPGICRTPDNNENLILELLSISEKHNIACQKITGFRATGGTETARIQLTANGVATANISIPNRYMHSVVEMCDLTDVESAIDLLVNSIIELQNINLNRLNLY